jgi:hypothetical protein
MEYKELKQKFDKRVKACVRVSTLENINYSLVYHELMNIYSNIPESLEEVLEGYYIDVFRPAYHELQKFLLEYNPRYSIRYISYELVLRSVKDHLHGLFF